MKNAIYIATPDKDYLTLIILAIITLILLSCFYLILKNKIPSLKSNFRQIAFLLTGLVGFIGLSASIFTTWNLYTIQPIKIYDTYIETYHGQTNYKEIAKVSIYNDQGRSFINPQVVTREDHILVIEKRNKQTMLFSGANYDLKKLRSTIREQMKAEN